MKKPFVHMFISHNKLTDDEFVERLRRQSESSRKASIGLSFLFGLLFLGILFAIPRLLQSLKDVSSEARVTDQGFYVGILLGAFVGFSLIVVAWHFIHAVFIAFGSHATGSHLFRLQRLLLKYHAIASKHTSGATPKT